MKAALLLDPFTACISPRTLLCCPLELVCKILLLKTPHTLVTGQRNQVGTNQEVPSMLASFHNPKGCLISCWGTEGINNLTQPEGTTHLLNQKGLPTLEHAALWINVSNRDGSSGWGSLLWWVYNLWQVDIETNHQTSFYIYSLIYVKICDKH